MTAQVIKYNDEQGCWSIDRARTAHVSNREGPHSGSRVLGLVAAALLASFSISAHAVDRPPPTPAPLPPAAPNWGLLASPKFEGKAEVGTFFFAGAWRFFAEPGRYNGPDGRPVRPATNNCLYTIFPLDGGTHLGWSSNSNIERRDNTLNLMIAAGVNVVNMSYWGAPEHDRWAFWAPMQTGPGSYLEVFDAAGGKPILVTPVIEDGGATLNQRQNDCPGDPNPGQGPLGRSPGFRFASSFPNDTDGGLYRQIEHLVTTFLKNPAKPEWRDKWTQMYGRDGVPRYVIGLMHVGTDQQVTAQQFVEGFDALADRVFDRLQVRIGFALDVYPPDSVPAPGVVPRLLLDPVTMGDMLARQSSVVAIQGFIPEIHTRPCRLSAGLGCDSVNGSSPALENLIGWKRQFHQKWLATGVPVIFDFSPGYDARIVFAPPVHDPSSYGNNQAWWNGQQNIVASLPGFRGITANSWNGFTETMVLVPSCGHRNYPSCPPSGPRPGVERAYAAFKTLVASRGLPVREPVKVTVTGPSTGTYSDTLRFTARLTKAIDIPVYDQFLPGRPTIPIPGKPVQFRVGTQVVFAATDANGVAQVSVPMQERPGTLSWTANFDGDTAFNWSEGQRASVTVRKETTRLTSTGANLPRGPTVPVSGRLLDDDNTSVVGKTVRFSIGPAVCSAVTDANGAASCIISGAPNTPGRVVNLSFAGDDFYEPAATTTAGCRPVPSPEGACSN